MFVFDNFKFYCCSELKLKTNELDEALTRERQQEQIIAELKRKNLEQSKASIHL